MPMTKLCIICQQVKSVFVFNKNPRSSDGYNHFCRCCGKRSKGTAPIVVTQKQCQECGEVKPISEYHKDRKYSQDGHLAKCKPCTLSRVKANCKARAARKPLLPANGMKTCTRCHETKLLSSFSKSRSYSDHHHPECRECYRLLQRPKGLQRTYGISEEEYAKMLEQQGGLCDICHKPETSARNGIVLHLAVDHDHVTGAIRGLLCGRCNTAVGLLDDSVTVLQSALDYLLYHSFMPQGIRKD